MKPVVSTLQGIIMSYNLQKMGKKRKNAKQMLWRALPVKLMPKKKTARDAKSGQLMLL